MLIVDCHPPVFSQPDEKRYPTLGPSLRPSDPDDPHSAGDQGRNGDPIVRFDSSGTPLQSPRTGELIRPPLEVVLGMASVLSAEFGYSVFKVDRFAGEEEPPKLLPQCLYIAIWNVQRRKVRMLVAAVAGELIFKRIL